MLLFAKVTAATPSAAMALARHLTAEPAISPATIRPDTHALLTDKAVIEPAKELTMRQVACLLAGRTLDGKRIEGRRYHPEGISAYDFILTPDKSISVAWAFADPADKAALAEAHRAAGEAAMAEVEKVVGQARMGNGGRDGAIPGHITWAATVHGTSKPMLEDGRVTHGDPDLHTHYSVPNVTVTDDGRVRALHTMALSGQVKRIGAHYQAVLADRLKQLGADITAHAITGATVLQDIPDRVREHFSRRGREVRQDGAGRRLTGDPRRDAELAKDGKPDLTAWHREATTIGWEPRSVIPHPMVRRAKAVLREMENLPTASLFEAMQKARGVHSPAPDIASASAPPDPPGPAAPDR